MQTIYLDISNKSATPVVYAKQGDIGRKFKAVVLENGIPRAITNETFSAGYDGASGSGNYEEIGDRSAFEVVDNAVTVEIAPNALLAPGTSNFCLTISGSDGTVIGLWNILVNVEETPGFLGDPIEDYYPGISAVLYVDQNLSEEEKAKARANIGSGTGNVKSVNGATPDENGNVVVAVGDGEGTPSANVFLGNENTTVAEYYEADQAGKICFMDRAMAGSGLWTWMMVNVNASLARFHTTDSEGNILHGILTSSGEWSYKAAEQGNNVFVGDENTSVSEYYEADQAGKACFMRRNRGGSGDWNWMLVNVNFSKADFHSADSNGNILFGRLLADGTWNYETKVIPTEVGVKSWNDLEDKPFGEIPGDTLTWDGNTDGLVTFTDTIYGRNWYKLSDAVPADTETESHNAVYQSPDGAVDFSEDSHVGFYDYELGYESTELYWDEADIPVALFVRKVGEYGAPETGVYFVKVGEGYYMHSLTIPGYTGFTTIKKLEGKYLPDGLPYVEQNGVLLAESSATAYTHASLGKVWEILKAPMLEVGKTYTVIYNGTAFDCVCQPAPTGFSEDPDAMAMGNFAVAGGPNTGEPFAMLISERFGRVDIVDLVGSASVIAGIRGEVVHKMDGKYLPNGIPKLFNVNVSVDFAGNATADKTYEEIKEKTRDSNVIVRAVVEMAASGDTVLLPLVFVTPERATFGIRLSDGSEQPFWMTLRVNSDDTAEFFIGNT